MDETATNPFVGFDIEIIRGGDEVEIQIALTRAKGNRTIRRQRYPSLAHADLPQRIRDAVMFLDIAQKSIDGVGRFIDFRLSGYSDGCSYYLYDGTITRDEYDRLIQGSEKSTVEITHGDKEVSYNIKGYNPKEIYYE